jgi:hypothetical protein
MEAMNLEAIEKEREKKLKADILTGTIRQKRLKEQLEEFSKNRRQALATVTSAAAGTSCQGHTASRRTEDEDDANTDDWQADLLHDVDEDTFAKLDTMAADLDEMATRERWLFCRSCKAWHRKDPKAGRGIEGKECPRSSSDPEETIQGPVERKSSGRLGKLCR